MTKRSFEVAVVGLGAAGSSVLYQLARRGVDAIGIDRYAPPHTRGSSHGETRITRQAIGEGEAYVPLVLRSNEIWEELEAATGQRLLARCGFIYITRNDAGTSHHGKSAFLGRTRAAAERFGIAHEILNATEIGTMFPQFVGLVGDERAYYEPGGGFLRPENCIATQLSRARALGARTVVDCGVDAIERSHAEIRLSTADGIFNVRQLVLATGSWLPRHASADIARRITVHRQVLHWFDVLDATAYRDGAAPTFIWTHGLDSHGQFYGFPPLDGQVKVAREDYGGAFDPDGPRDTDPRDGQAMASDHVDGRLAGLARWPAASEVCHYAVTDDNDFIVDRDRDDPRVWLVSACSGHGFKHAAAVGEAIAQSIAGESSSLSLEPFSASRFTEGGGPP